MKDLVGNSVRSNPTRRIKIALKVSLRARKLTRDVNFETELLLATRVND